MRDAAFKSVAVGFFDGVHLGHQKILRKADSALTFGVHPLSVLAPDRAPDLIMPLEDRLAAIDRPTTVLDFTPELAALSPEDFAARHLAGRKVFCGANWNFGKDGAGDAEWLRARGYEVEIVDYAEYGGERISSSRIRACLSRGELDDVSAMLGRRYALTGPVVQGKGLGTQMGFPTVNVQPSVELALARGVYEVDVAGCRGLANYGLAPTMGDRAWTKPVLEVHFTHAVPDIQLSRLRVEFLRFIRPERSFGSVEQLRAQIAEDVRTVAG